MPFFIRPKGQKRKLPEKSKYKNKKHTKRIEASESKPKRDDVIESSSSDDEEFERIPDSPSEDEDALLTAQEKKVKLAKKYLQEVEAVAGNGGVLECLNEQELEKAGKLRRKIANNVDIDDSLAFSLKCKQQKLPVTCLATSDKFIYSASKDACLVKWSLVDKGKVAFTLSSRNSKSQVSKGHAVTINCLAVTADDSYLASGDESGLINVWEAKGSELVFSCQFKGHKSGVTGLAVCTHTNYLYSSAKDALVKVWSLSEKGYVETLFGHTAAAMSVDVLSKDRVVSSGADRSLRVWKIQEESQLIFNGHERSVDVVKRVADTHFISGGDDGSICLWGFMKKKPLYTESKAHGSSPTNSQPNWIISLASMPNSDLIASGSNNGYVRLWKCADNLKSISPVASIPACGYINAIAFSQNHIILALGKEHRLGRWNCDQRAKNLILCLPIVNKS